jgi:hypothetical protein
MRYITRPLTPEARQRLVGQKRDVRSPFSAPWGRTMQLLDDELRHLKANDVVLQRDIDESDLRLDGTLRANARAKSPVVALSFTTGRGDLLFVCGRFSRWEDNVRAIALALESLRQIERYGIVQSDEQYRGWQALPPGTPMPAAKMTLDEAAHLLAEHGELLDPPHTIHLDDIDASFYVRSTGTDDDAITTAWKRAAKQHHPDVGGDPDLFRRLTEARDLLLGAR